MKRYLTTFAAVAALAAGLAYAQTSTAPQTGQTPGRAGLLAGVRQRVLKSLDLTADQQAQIKAILQGANQAAQPIRQQLQQNQQAIAAAVKANNVAQIQQLATVAGGLQSQLVVIRATARAKFYAVLTPDQQTKLEDALQKVKQLLGPRAAQAATP
ncbi:MAG: Spy/CpxP family protein refolding chaperone [Bryobacteraceae bacterium]|jgi:Spy/CpxP family protein refolding chaperone